jgi:hypothetical protein
MGILDLIEIIGAACVPCLQRMGGHVDTSFRAVFLPINPFYPAVSPSAEAPFIRTQGRAFTALWRIAHDLSGRIAVATGNAREGDYLDVLEELPAEPSTETVEKGRRRKATVIIE